MKFVIFRSSKGDCLLISAPGGNGNNHVLVDGGMSASFKESVAPYLNKNIKQVDEEIDLLCVSHIDDDHIVGVLTLMDLLADWRVYNYHQKNGNTSFKKPKLPEPPNVSSLWHNSFAKTYELGSEIPKVEQALHEVEQMTLPHLRDDLLRDVHEKAASIKKGITLSQMIRPEQLGIVLNDQWGGKLVKCNQRYRDKNEHSIGNMKISIIGPFSSDLNDLRDKWRKWEKKHRAELKDFYADLASDSLSNQVSSAALRNMFHNSGSVDLTLGKRGEVSVPNLASIMFLIKSGGKTILMTGDGHADDILKGLKKNKKLNSKGAMHVDVLKVQHHGADANLTKEFVKKITATNYVFCGNGSHHNPEIEVLDLIFNSRQGSDEQLSENKEVGKPFKFWLNVNPNDKLTKGQKKQIDLVEEKLIAFKALAGDDFNYEFMPVNKHEMTIDLT